MTTVAVNLRESMAGQTTNKWGLALVYVFLMG